MKALYLIILLMIIIIVLYILYWRPLHSSSEIIQGNTEYPANKLMIVAHPDDELIFGGSELIENPGWKVVSITNATKKSMNRFSPTRFSSTENFRKREFIEMMNKLKCQYEMWDYEDNYFNANWNENLILNQLNKLISEKNYEIILTHNLQGEYGHTQHKRVSQLVHQLANQMLLNNLWVFNTDKNITNPYSSKIKELAGIYGSQNTVIDEHYEYIIHQSKKYVNTK